MYVHVCMHILVSWMQLWLTVNLPSLALVLHMYIVLTVHVRGCHLHIVLAGKRVDGLPPSLELEGYTWNVLIKEMSLFQRLFMHFSM